MKQRSNSKGKLEIQSDNESETAPEYYSRT